MTKAQKVWLWIFLAMFIVPELLWSPVGNFIFELYQSGNTHPFRNNFLQDSSNVNILSTVLFVQMLGVIFALIYLAIIHKSIKNKMIFWISYLFLFLIGIIIFFLFGFSVSLRHIGF